MPHVNCFLATIWLTDDSSHAVSLVQLPGKTNLLFFQKLVVGWIPIVLQRWGIVLQTARGTLWVGLQTFTMKNFKKAFVVGQLRLDPATVRRLFSQWV